MVRITVLLAAIMGIGIMVFCAPGAAQNGPPTLVKQEAGASSGASAEGTTRPITAETAAKVKQIAVFQGHKHIIFALAFSPDSALLASGSSHIMETTVRLWDVGSRKQAAVLEGHTAPVAAVSFNTDGSILASAGCDKTIRLWDVKARKQASLQEHDPKNKGTVPNIDNCSATFSPDGNTLAYCVSGGAEILLWDLKTISQRSLKLTTTVRRVPGKIAFTADGKMIAATLGQPTAVEGFTGTNIIQFWDLQAGKPASSLTGPADAAYADQGLAISPDGAMLSVVDENTHAIQLFDVKAGKATTLLKGHTDGVYTIAFSPDGSLLASASYDKTVRLWDVKKGAQVVSLAGHKQGASAVVFSPNGGLLATSDLGGDVILWGVPVK